MDQGAVPRAGALRAVKALITGTGRCGTRWLATVLRNAGIPTGHEAVFGPRKVTPRPGLDVDVSWLALTYPPAQRDLPTLLMAREPVGCIASLMDSLVFTEGDAYTKAVERVMPLTGDAFTDACRWWCWVNTRPADVRWRVDEPDSLAAALATVGLEAPVRPREIQDPHPLPGKTRTTVLTWDDIPVEVLRVAEDWGWPC